MAELLQFFAALLPVSVNVSLYTNAGGLMDCANLSERRGKKPSILSKNLGTWVL